MAGNFMKKFLFCILFTVSMGVSAGIQVEATRVVYQGGNNSASLSISNNGDDTYMVQTWLDTGDAAQLPQDLPILVTPPILKLASRKEAILRFIYSGTGLPQDRESLFWVNVQEIPPAAKEENVLQIAIRTRVKLFYRPAGLKTDLAKQAAAMTWQRQGGQLVVRNAGPLHVTLGVVTLLDSHGGSWVVPADMVKPGSDIHISIPAEAKSASMVKFSYINDYGGHTEVDSVGIGE